MEQKNIYKTPDARLIDDAVQDERREFFTSSLMKVFVLFVATFGSYSTYWFYKHWEHRKRYFGEDVIPVMRCLFAIFFVHTLFERMRTAAVVRDLNVGSTLGVMATIYVILSIVSRIFDKMVEDSEVVGALDFVSFAIVFILVVPLYIAQGVANRVNNDPDGLINNKFSVYNYLFIVPGVSLWLLIVAAYSGVDVNPIFDFIG